MHPFLQTRLASQVSVGGHRKLLKGVVSPHRLARAVVRTSAASPPRVLGSGESSTMLCECC